MYLNDACRWASTSHLSRRCDIVTKVHCVTAILDMSSGTRIEVEILCTPYRAVNFPWCQHLPSHWLNALRSQSLWSGSLSRGAMPRQSHNGIISISAGTSWWPSTISCDAYAWYVDAETLPPLPVQLTWMFCPVSGSNGQYAAHRRSRHIIIAVQLT